MGEVLAIYAAKSSWNISIIGAKKSTGESGSSYQTNQTQCAAGSFDS